MILLFFFHTLYLKTKNETPRAYACGFLRTACDMIGTVIAPRAITVPIEWIGRGGKKRGR